MKAQSKLMMWGWRSTVCCSHDHTYQDIINTTEYQGQDKDSTLYIEGNKTDKNNQ